jgi:dihydrofolate reductase
MGIVTADMSVSLDGFISGPKDLDDGFYRVQEWIGEAFSWREQQGMEGGEANRDSEIFAEKVEQTGAYVMGRRMFDVGEEPWGDEPPFNVPVFVVTHHARDTLVKDGGTTFTFVTDGVESAVEQARRAAGDKNVAVAGGANIVQQVLRGGWLDRLQLHISPVLLGDGMRLFDVADHDHIELSRTRVVETDGVTHIQFEVVRTP